MTTATPPSPTSRLIHLRGGRALLTDAWEALKPVPEQIRMQRSKARHNVVRGGRRSGKTIRKKRKIIMEALSHDKPWPGLYMVGMPTRDQVRRVWWSGAQWPSLRDLLPARLISDIRETDLTIELISGTKIWCAGLDKPMRMDGIALDGAVLDEIDDMKPRAYEENVRPALSTLGREGWCDFIGKPRGKKKLYELERKALDHKAAGGTRWDAFHWKSSDVLSADEIQAAKEDLDDITYRQEYEAEYVLFDGRAYYNYQRETHSARRWCDFYRSDLDLVFTFDFNRSPGVAGVIQQLRILAEDHPNRGLGGDLWAKIGEVHIPTGSNTPRVCDKLIADWGSHRGHVWCYGDATGGRKYSASERDMSDWDLIEEKLAPVFGHRLHFCVPSVNPDPRSRVNAVNSMFSNVIGVTRFVVCPVGAPKSCEDFEDVAVLDGGAGDVDKRNHRITHLSDGDGYFLDQLVHPQDYDETSFWDAMS